MLTILVTVVVFGVLIFIHELGHFLAARGAGVRVHEFALGFGPRLLAWRRGETEYAVRAFPLGGFVRMAGMHPGEDGLERVPYGERFGAQPVGRRIGIIAAGPLMNLLLAVLLFLTLFAVVGVPVSQLVVEDVLPGYPAAESGLRPGDRLVAIDGRTLGSWSELVATVRRSTGVPLRLTVERDGRRLEVVVTPRANPRDRQHGIIGVRPRAEHVRRPPAEATLESVLWTGRVIVGFFDGIGRMIRGQDGADLIGPVGIGQQLGEAAEAGLAQVLFLAAVLSANLGLINLLPIPALDGSRLVFLGLEAVRGRPVDPEKENVIHLVGFALLILLAIVITYRDILRLST